jgi:hypothetical protein
MLSMKWVSDAVASRVRRWAHGLEDEMTALLHAFSPAAAADADRRPELLLSVAKKLRKEALGHSSGALSKVAGVELCARLVRAGLAPSRAAQAATAAAASAEAAAESKEAANAAKAAGKAATAKFATDASGAEWLTSLLEAQLFFLESLALQQQAGGGVGGASAKAKRRLRQASKSVEGLVLHWGEVGVANRPALLQTYFNLVANDSNLTGPAAAAAAAVSTTAAFGGASAFAGLSVLGQLCLNPANAARLPGGTPAAWHEALLQRYRDVVWPSSQGQSSLPPHVLQSFAPLLPWLLPTTDALAGGVPKGGDSEDVDSASLLASIVKLLKKCPETVVPALASLTQNLQVQGETLETF